MTKTFYEIYDYSCPSNCQVLRTDEFNAFAEWIARIAKNKNRGQVMVNSREVNFSGGVPAPLK